MKLPYQLCGIYFSPTGNSKTICQTFVETLQQYTIDHTPTTINITTPNQRTNTLTFTNNQLLTLTLPVYAGRIPNKLYPFVANQLKGDHTPTIISVTYGNRNYDNALKELQATLTPNGFDIIAAAALPCQHAFTNNLATGRPNDNDIQQIVAFAKQIVQKIYTQQQASTTHKTLQLPGNWPCNYYTPQKEDNTPANFLKAKPTTDTNKCNKCMICVKLCPMGSIDKHDPTTIGGICIKCHSCIQHCPQKAKHFKDAELLSHIKMLENNYTEEKQPAFFL
ncbi:MAG: EFR1 family ferrodoxin [Bacteroidales bacterium]|nr:EFR1 family ferrodoxin [Bacteroidales bacterium]